MDITPKELEHLKQIAAQVASGSHVEEVTVTYEEDGEEKTVRFTHPYFLSLFERAALEVNRKYNGENDPAGE